MVGSNYEAQKHCLRKVQHLKVAKTDVKCIPNAAWQHGIDKENNDYVYGERILVIWIKLLWLRLGGYFFICLFVCLNVYILV